MSYILHLGHQPTDIAGISGLLNTTAGGFDANLDVNAIRHSGSSTYSAPFSFSVPEPAGDLWFQRGGWADYPEWNRHAERPTTEVEVATWAAWPDCGIGIVGGAVAAVDIDIATDAELALQIEALARARLGDTPALRIGRAPKRMLVYRTAAPFRGIKRHPLEVLCLGQQFLAYADHPDTGAPYVWPDEGLADLDISDLPEITAEAAAAFLDEANAILPEALRQRGLRSAAPATYLRNHGQIGTLPASLAHRRSLDPR